MSKQEANCTKRCRSRHHGQAITSAITKRSVSDDALACFIKSTCTNCTQAFDFEGRTALHMATSRGRLKLMEWLIKHSSEAFINARDRESGYTPLHRSIFYGQIHATVALMKMGVNTEIVDKDDYKALEHAMLDRQYMYKQESSLPCDVYVWGSNSNYTLGTGSQQPRQIPEVLGCFNRIDSSIVQVCLGKFHSVWVGADGKVWAGGQVARAGASHGTALRPAPLRLQEPCVAAALTLTSTVLLLHSGTVIQYTLNTADISQAAAKTPPVFKLPSVKPLIKLSKPIGVCSGRSHAVVWNSRAIYTWGTNLGQLGHSQEDKFVPAPKRVAVSVNNKEEVELRLAAAADGATLLATSRGDVYLLHKHICKKIAIKQINLTQVCVDAKVSDQGVYSRVTVLLLTTVGQLHIWQDTTNKLTRCVFGLNHQTIITNVALTHDAMYFTTKYGQAFNGSISRKATPPSQPQPIKKEKRDNKSSLMKFLEKDDCTSVRITRIPNVHRAVFITVDNEGLNFACLQAKPTCGLRSLPELSPSSLSKHMDTLLETATEDDMLHDIIFKVGTKLFPAHIFIVASESEHLHNLYQEQVAANPTEIPTVTLDNVLPEAFERVLRYIYTGTCDVAELGPCGLKIRKEDLVNKKKVTELIDDEDENGIDNASEISAFEAYKQEKVRKNVRGKRNTNQPAPRQHVYCDPVKLVQATAKRLQVLTLHKLLDKFYYKEGTVCLKESATYTKNEARPFDRASFPSLVDTRVCSRDGQLVPAHKCVLAARLEYFHGMFMHSWTESKLLSTVTLPINYNILLPVIDFLYTDSCDEIAISESIDFICSMMIVADQLFITRLREMCEVALANLINLKNCVELCQFAHTYNATQLKQCCMEFICLNICSILENRSLDCLEETLLHDITNYYCKFNPIMSSRIITPFYNASSDDVIEESLKNYPLNLEVVDEELKRDDIIENSKKKNKQSKKIEYTENEKARMRYESVSSVTSLDLSNENTGDITLSLSKINKDTEKGSGEKQEKWIEVPSSQQKQQKVVLARLKAISTAADIMTETPPESFTKLVKNNSSTAIWSPPPTHEPTSSRMSVSPKESSINELVRSTQGNLVINHVGPKLSQKQRKKLAMQGESSPPNIDGFASTLQVSSPPNTPKNPWKICELPIASSSPNKKELEFNQILADQKKQKDDNCRILSKPLSMTQLEDKAIEELERFYNVHEADDELITVRRIDLQVSSPQWLHTAPK